ncbi:MAG: hypothetical protein IPK60_16290 [Sandaracinaceae bacterium]|nr:hypothetical protein [Sandaracinaceae bacterium]
MVRKVLTGWVIAACLAGCAAQVGQEPKAEFDVAADDAVIGASEGLADSATRPTILGALESGELGLGGFTRTKKYIGFYFDANEGDEITLETTPRNPVDLDTVLILYNATSSGRPSGASLAVNDDISDNNLLSKIEFTAEATRRYVAVVRRYDRGTSGTFGLSLNITSHSEPAVCGGRGGVRCPSETQFCEFAPEDNCGRSDAMGTCREIPTAFPRNMHPVCGCDGETYTNPTYAAGEGVSVDYEGSCSAMCPATGVSCSPTCPGSGRINGRPCHRGNFNERTCTCEPLADCRTLGCESEGTTCQLCWASYACIPNGAVC